VTVLKALMISLILLTFCSKLSATVITEVKVLDGNKAWLVEEHSIPFVTLEIRFKGGATLDRVGKRGSVYFMSALLNEGADDLDASAFAKEMERLAVELDFNVYQDSLSISFKFLTENKSASINLLKKALTKPRFEEEPFERVRDQILSILKSNAKDPRKIASKVFFENVFGSHPYGSMKDGNLESILSLSREDILNAYEDTFNRNQIFISAVGDIKPNELRDLVNEVIEKIPAHSNKVIDQATYKFPEGNTVIDFDTPQSVTIFGHDGIKRTDKDFFSAYVLTHILGGSGFGSRLMTELREKNGLTYGVSAYLASWEKADLILGQFASSNNTVMEAIGIVRKEWAALADRGVTADELQDAKTFLTGAYPLRFDGNSRIARILVGMQTQGLPMDYIHTRNAKVNAVTMEDIRRVSARILKEENLYFVIVGRPTS
jgi:zinc protease|tara:strand:+ start:811 stop:2112 length:1302 start_codon:yes stop_codon:yes gene_type:complete